IVFLFLLIFFFQAEDGIRDRNVTGVQTCALPILPSALRDLLASVREALPAVHWRSHSFFRTRPNRLIARHIVERPSASPLTFSRSEERRVGKECGARWRASLEVIEECSDVGDKVE